MTHRLSPEVEPVGRGGERYVVELGKSLERLHDAEAAAVPDAPCGRLEAGDFETAGFRKKLIALAQAPQRFRFREKLEFLRGAVLQTIDLMVVIAVKRDFAVALLRPVAQADDERMHARLGGDEEFAPRV